jgi:hypothetical protein
MNLVQYRRPGLLALLLGSLVLSCSKMDDTYRDFIKDGEIVYPAKVESVQTFTGNKRMDLSMLLTSDPNITKVKVFWNNGKDSAEKSVQRTSGVDTVRFALHNIEEGTYTFNIYTYDQAGHRSVKTDIIGNVYGDRYTGALYNRSLKSVTYLTGSKARLIWIGPAAQMIGQEIKYTDSLGVAQRFLEPLYKADGITLKDTTVLATFKKGSAFEFRTLFKPESASLDTFYSGYETRIVQ